MATAQDAVSRLQIETTSDGSDAAADSLNKLAEAYGGVAVASSSVEKTTSSLDSKFASIERRYNDQVKAQQDFQKIQNTVNAAVSQNPALQERANAVLAAAKQRYDDLTGTQSLFGKGLDAAGEKASELTRELGPLGTVLALIGPVGIAVGAAITVAVLALDKLRESANEAGQWAQSLQQSANVIGLNTTQLQGLNEAAAQVGVSAQDNVSAFEKFSVSLGQLKDGSGSLYTELLKVNPQLVNQMSVTKDSATAWNLLAQAYSAANAQQQALITRAAFGRGGAAQGQVLQATANAGGISGLTSANQEDAISQDQIKRWADLTTQINSATEAASHNFQSIFTTQILTSEKNFADNMLSISQYAKQFTLSDDLKYYLEKGALIVAGSIPGVGAFVRGASALSNLTKPGFIPSPGSSSVPAQSALPPAPNFDATFGAVDKSNAAAVTASLGVQATQAKALVSALGGAATAQDKLDATTKQLKFDLDKNIITQATYDKALSGAQLDAAISKQALYNSALGELASTTDLVAAKSLALQRDQQQGAGLTAAQITAVKNLTAANDEWSHVNGQAQIGIFDLGAATKAAGDQLQSWKDRKLLDPTNTDQMASAQQNLANKLQATSDAAKVAGSAFPQLTQLGLDAGNVNKQFDAFATTSANAVAPALEGILNGTTTLSAGFKNLGLSIATALEDAIIKLTIIKPLVDGVLGASGAGGGLLSFLGLGGVGSIGSAASSAGGVTAAADTISFAAANGGTFGPGWGLVGERGPEIIQVHSAGVTVYPNSVSAPYLPKFADGGSLSPNGNVTRLSRSMQNNDAAIHVTSGDTIINIQGNADQATLAIVQQQLAARDKEFGNNVVKVVRQAKTQRHL